MLRLSNIGLADHILPWMCFSVDLALAFINFKNVIFLVDESCYQLTAQNYRRYMIFIPFFRILKNRVLPSFFVGCIYEFRKIMLYIHRDSDEITDVIALMNEKYFVWHHEIKHFSSISKKKKFFFFEFICRRCSSNMHRMYGKFQGNINFISILFNMIVFLDIVAVSQPRVSSPPASAISHNMRLCPFIISLDSLSSSV